MNQIAETIVEQCGGTGMIRMIGVSAIIHGKNSAKVRFKCRALYGINCFEVILDPSDSYTVKFYKSTVKGDSLKYEINDIYCDQLIELIESKTGLKLRMPRIYSADGRRLA
jgi:hypothetical protein